MPTGVIVINSARISGRKDDTYDAALIASTLPKDSSWKDCVVARSVIFSADNFDPNFTCCNMSSIIQDTAHNVVKIVHRAITAETSG